MKSKKNPLITVYITSYNYGRFIEQSIQSVLKQSFTDYELIIIDDGSTDNSAEIIQKYEIRKNVLLVFNKNKGLNASNNVALRLARGKYIIRLDADDFLADNALEIMANKMKKNSSVAMVFPDYYMVDENANIINIIKRHDFDNEVTLFDQPAHGACTLIKTDLLKKLGGYDEEFTRQDGYDLWLKVIHKHKVSNINIPLFYYRKHGSSITDNEIKLLETRAAIKSKHVKLRKLPAPSVLAIIPVRGSLLDARSFPLRQLGDKKLIDWTIQEANSVTNIKNILISTPSPDVKSYIEKNYSGKVQIMERNIQLARINTDIDNTVLDILDKYLKKHRKPELVLMLYIEAPFRSSRYIQKAIDTLQLYHADSVEAVRPDDSIFYRHNGKGLQPINNSPLRLEREEIYKKVGGMQLIKTDYLLGHKTLQGGKVSHIILDAIAGHVIRNENDWEIAQFYSHKTK